MIKNDLTPDERAKQEAIERKHYAAEAEKARAHQLNLAQIANERPNPPVDPWPVIKSIAYAPCYLFALLGVVTLALFNRQVPQVLVDFLNS